MRLGSLKSGGSVAIGWCAAWGWAGLLASASPLLALEASLGQNGRELRIELGALPPGEHEVVIETPGLRHLETSASVGEPGIIYLPPPQPGEELTPEAELYFFFHSLAAAPGWELVIEFLPRVAGEWALNGRFAGLTGALPTTVVLPVEALEPGENLLHVRSSVLATPRLHYRRTLAQGQQSAVVPVLEPWQGTVTVRSPSSGRRASAEVRDPRCDVEYPAAPPGTVPAGALPGARDLWNAALAVGRHLLASEVVDDNSLFAGGFHLVYDVPQGAPRMHHWLWAWGPAIRLLLELETSARAQGETRLAESFRTTALRAAHRSLAFEVTDRAHPASGVSTVRWEPSRATPSGWAEYISTADSLFLAGWGWMAAHRATGEAVFLERTRSLVAAASRLMEAYPVVPQDWIVERRRWTPHILDESVFGLTGFHELHRATGETAVAAAGRRFLETHLAEMGREDGLLERAWLRDEDRAIWNPDIKGHAWVVEGYLAAFALSGERRYLDLARALAGRVLGVQSPSGAWGFSFEPAGEAGPFDDKGTAIWAYYLYRLHTNTGEDRHLEAARRALHWCLQRQYRGPHPRLDGGVLHENGMAYVRRRPMTILYSTTFFGLALLEELKQRE